MGTGQLKALASFLGAFPVPASSMLAQGSKSGNMSKVCTESRFTQQTPEILWAYPYLSNIFNYLRD